MRIFFSISLVFIEVFVFLTKILHFPSLFSSIVQVSRLHVLSHHLAVLEMGGSSLQLTFPVGCLFGSVSIVKNFIFSFSSKVSDNVEIPTMSIREGSENLAEGLSSASNGALLAAADFSLLKLGNFTFRIYAHSYLEFGLQVIFAL